MRPGLIIALALILQTALAFAAPKLAYTRVENGYWQIWMSDLNGANSRQLTSGLWDKRTLRTASPGRLFFRNNEGKMFTMNGSGTNAPIPILPDFDIVKDFDFHPKYGYLISSYAPNSIDNVVIWWCSSEGAGRKLLIPDAFLNEMPRWQNDGKGLFFVKSHRGRSVLCHSELSVPKARELLTMTDAPVTDPCPSPDGNWVAFCREKDKNMNLWLTKADGKQPRELYSEAGLETEPCWSPDSKSIFFSTWDGRNFRVARIPVSGGKMEYITAAGVDSRSPAILHE